MHDNFSFEFYMYKIWLINFDMAWSKAKEKNGEAYQGPWTEFLHPEDATIQLEHHGIDQPVVSRILIHNMDHVEEGDASSWMIKGFQIYNESGEIRPAFSTVTMGEEGRFGVYMWVERMQLWMKAKESHF
jgi:hypothetical protein